MIETATSPVTQEQVISLPAVDPTPLPILVGELSDALDSNPADVLDALILADVSPFWIDGQQFRDVTYLRTTIRLHCQYDLTRDVQCDLTPEQVCKVAEVLMVSECELREAVR